MPQGRVAFAAGGGDEAAADVGTAAFTEALRRQQDSERAAAAAAKQRRSAAKEEGSKASPAVAVQAPAEAAGTGMPSFLAPAPTPTAPAREGQQGAAASAHASGGGGDAWPPAFDSPNPPVALPFMRLPGDAFSGEAAALPRLRARSASTASAGTTDSKQAAAAAAAASGRVAMDDATLLSVSAAAGVLPNPALVRDSAALATAASSHVGHLFQRDGSLALPDGELLLLQLPTRLPVREALDHSQAAYEFDATIPPEARPSGGQQASGGSAAAPAAGLDERQRAALDEARGLGHRRMDPHGLRDSWAKAGSGGRLGTLRVHASGKVTLVVGDVTLDVASGTIMRHAVDAAVITTSTVQVPPEDGEEGDAGVSKRVGDMHMLGRVTHKLVATPSLEGMLPAWATKAGMVEAASQSNREHEKLAASMPGAIGRAPPATSAPQSKATSALLEGSDSDEDAVLG